MRASYRLVAKKLSRHPPNVESMDKQRDIASYFFPVTAGTKWSKVVMDGTVAGGRGNKYPPPFFLSKLIAVRRLQVAKAQKMC